MSNRRCLTIVLAAGEGTRMRSALPKVLHQAAGRSLLAHAVASAQAAGSDRIAVVIGPGHDAVAAEARRIAPQAEIFVQAERRGTGHAVLAARAAIEAGSDDVIVLYGDTPLVEPQTLAAMRAAVAAGAGVAALGFEAANPKGYGRFITADGQLLAIREDKDCTEAERAITLCNAGFMAFDGRHALAILDRIEPNNAQKEYYLTDAVEIARARGLSTVALAAPEAEVQGVNTRAQLAQVEATLQGRLRARAMENGATLVAPETVFLAHDTRLGRDVVIEPNVVFGPGVVVEDDVVIHAFSHLEGAHVGKGASVGPFARLRPGASLGAKVRIGNFVEVKNATMEAGAKANHLAYVGDGHVGAGANLGAGTIFCNYDGYNKHRTEVGANAFIGSNSALVAPVRVGEGAYVGSGSVITDDVPADALALGRGRQVVKEGWARDYRAGKEKKK